MKALTWNQIKRNEKLHAEAKARFESAWNNLQPAGFGQRTPTGVVACAERCSHPGCSQGCTLQGRK